MARTGSLRRSSNQVDTGKTPSREPGPPFNSLAGRLRLLDLLTSRIVPIKAKASSVSAIVIVLDSRLSIVLIEAI